MRWTRRVAYRKLSIRSVYKNLVRKSEERGHLGDKGIDGRIILK